MREGGREDGREGGRKGGREGGREELAINVPCTISYPYLAVSLLGHVSPSDWFISLTRTSIVPGS